MSLIEQLGGYQINWDLGKDITYEILIANLGGYEKAKHELELKEQGSVLQCCAAVTADMIRYALLEYRRQHNIFEVGDWAFTNNEDFSEEPCQLIEDMGYDFRYETKSGRWGFIVKSFLPKAWRHAKDEEIEANKRLGNEEEH